jgi:hypothetical protein
LPSTLFVLAAGVERRRAVSVRPRAEISMKSPGFLRVRRSLKRLLLGLLRALV